MSGKRYPEEFKIEAVKQVINLGYSVSSVATRLDITTHSLYAWIKKYGPDSSTNKEQSDAQAEIRRLQRRFNPDAPDERWVTDITYIRTHEGWLYLAVVVDLFSRKVIGWSMQPRMTKEIVLNALLMALWRRNSQKAELVHSDQGSQYTSHEWQSFLKSHGLEGSMSRRGNCHDNAVAESFFQLLKRERIKKKIYGTREEARSDIFDYIEMFYNSKRRHGSSDKMPPTEYENRY